MIPLELFGWLHGNRRLEERAAQVADSARDEVWSKIAGRAGELSAAEARGYVRARAATILARRAAETAAREQLSESARRRLQERSLGLLVAELAPRLTPVAPLRARRAA